MPGRVPSVFATTYSLLRSVIVHSLRPAWISSLSECKLSIENRISLLDEAMEMLKSVGRLHKLMVGRHERFFLSIFFFFFFFFFIDQPQMAT